jgi:hypothetical protein
MLLPEEYHRRVQGGKRSTVKEAASYNMKYNLMTLLYSYGPCEIILVLEFFHLRSSSG